MNRIMRSAKFFILGLLALALLPAGVLAEQLTSETITVEVNVTTPQGTQITGTVVARRTLGTEVNTEVSFNGLINGEPASGTATAVEHWLGNGQEDIEVTAVTSWRGPGAAPQPIAVHMAQDASGMLLINGAPLAINGTLEAPGSGSRTYAVAAAGQGSQPIAQLPNMGAGPQSQLASEPAGTVTMVAMPLNEAGGAALAAVLLLIGASLGLGGLRLVALRRGA